MTVDHAVTILLVEVPMFILLVLLAFLACAPESTTEPVSDTGYIPEDPVHASVTVDSKEPDTEPPPEYVLIPAGTFMMGSPEDEIGRDQWSEEQHEVKIPYSYYVMTAEVTQDEFTRFEGYNPSYFVNGSNPVETVTWYEAAGYANWLSTSEGFDECYRCQGVGPAVTCGTHAVATCSGYRLPTEEEWEYAARAGTSAAFTDGGNLASNDDMSECDRDIVLTSGNRLGSLAWYCATSPKANRARTTSPVMGLEPNAWGLYDVQGNVAEWTEVGDNVYDDNPQYDYLRWIRGGDARHDGMHARLASRIQQYADHGSDYLGIRLVRTGEEAAVPSE